MRQIVLDTETTGLEWRNGHRVIEIGCVELVNRTLTGRHYHVYLSPEREVDAGAVQVEVAGKRRVYRLTEDPLPEVLAWCAPYVELWRTSLDRLQVALDEEDR